MRTSSPLETVPTAPARRSGPSIAAAVLLTAAALGTAIAEHGVASSGAETARTPAVLSSTENVARSDDVNAFRRLLPPTRADAGRG